jgi:hypothetical protein
MKKAAFRSVAIIGIDISKSSFHVDEHGNPELDKVCFAKRYNGPRCAL